MDDESLSRSHVFVGSGRTASPSRTAGPPTVSSSTGFGCSRDGHRRPSRRSWSGRRRCGCVAPPVRVRRCRPRRRHRPHHPHGIGARRHRRRRDRLSRSATRAVHGLGSHGSLPWRRCPWPSLWPSSSDRSCCSSRHSDRSHCSPARSVTGRFQAPAPSRTGCSRARRPRWPGANAWSTHCAPRASDSTGPTPTPPAVLSSGRTRGAGLVGRLVGGVRLGRGELATRITWVEGILAQPPFVRGAPLVVDLDEVGCLGVVGAGGGSRGAAVRARRSAVRGPSPAPAHRVGGFARSLVVVGGTAAARRRRAGRRRSRRERGSSATARRRIRAGRCVCWSCPARVRSRISSACSAAADGALVVAGASTRAELPGGCRAVVPSRSTALGRVRRHRRVGGVRPRPGPGSGGPTGSRARSLRCGAPTRRHGGGCLPASPWPSCSADRRSPTWVADRWRAGLRRWSGHGRAPRRRGRRAGPDGPHVIDLCRDGPHVLVGGTTGSGKSEFLRTLVTSLAISTPPEEVTFVLVDFKGGAAFGAVRRPAPRGRPRHRPRRPPRLRALSSLRAELRRRERLFAARRRQ